MRPQVTTLYSSANRRAVILGAVATSAIAFSGITAPLLAAETKMLSDEAYAKAKAGEIILIDIRTPEEWKQTGIGEGAIAMDMRTPQFVQSLSSLRQIYPDKPIAFICATGNRSGYVFEALNARGFPDLVDVTDGMMGGRNGKGWLRQNLPTYKGEKSEIAARLEAVINP